MERSGSTETTAITTPPQGTSKKRSIVDEEDLCGQVELGLNRVHLMLVPAPPEATTFFPPALGQHSGGASNGKTILWPCITVENSGQLESLQNEYRIFGDSEQDYQLASVRVIQDLLHHVLSHPNDEQRYTEPLTVLIGPHCLVTQDQRSFQGLNKKNLFPMMTYLRHFNAHCGKIDGAVEAAKVVTNMVDKIRSQRKKVPRLTDSPKTAGEVHRDVASQAIVVSPESQSKAPHDPKNPPSDLPPMEQQNARDVDSSQEKSSSSNEKETTPNASVDTKMPPNSTEAPSAILVTPASKRVEATNAAAQRQTECDASQEKNVSSSTDLNGTKPIVTPREETATPCVVSSPSNLPSPSASDSSTGSPASISFPVSSATHATQGRQFRFIGTQEPSHPTFSQVQRIFEKGGYSFEDDLFCLPDGNPNLNKHASKGHEYFEKEDDFRQNLCQRGVVDRDLWNDSDKTLIHQWVRMAVIKSADLNFNLPTDVVENEISPSQTIKLLLKIGFKYVRSPFSDVFLYPGIKTYKAGVEGITLFEKDMDLQDHLARYGLPNNCKFDKISVSEHVSLEYFLSNVLTESVTL